MTDYQEDPEDPSIYSGANAIPDSLIAAIKKNVGEAADIYSISTALHLFMSEKINAQNLDKIVEWWAEAEVEPETEAKAEAKAKAKAEAKTKAEAEAEAEAEAGTGTGTGTGAKIEAGTEGKTKNVKFDAIGTNKPIYRQLILMERILHASETLLAYLDPRTEFSSLDHRLGDAYENFCSQGGNAGAVVNNEVTPSWPELRNKLYHDLVLLRNSGYSVRHSLKKINIPRGQPKKEFRDEVLLGALSVLMNHFNLPSMVSFRIVASCWSAYFPGYYVTVDSAKKAWGQSVKGI